VNLLVVEDDPKTLAFLRKGLSESGFVVDGAADGVEGLHLARTRAHDLMVIDIMLPKLDGEGLLRELRAGGDTTPAIFLTARGEVEDRIRGLKLGADDYLVKPFAFSELLERIRAILRRSRGQGPGGAAAAGANPLVLRHADLTIELSPRRVRRGDRRIELTPKEFALLELLVRHAGEVLTRSLIEERVWDINFGCETNVVDVHIRRLRAKVEEGFPGPKLIHTVRGVGYVLEARS
jgi:two-component system copper resistance phosphate regulon response regulator CusR